MVNMVLDIGNSYTKIAFFKYDEMIWFRRFSTLSEFTLAKIIKKHRPQKGIVSAVSHFSPQLHGLLNKSMKLIDFQPDRLTSVKNHYRTPETLGLDRLAGIAGALHLYPQKGNLVIDTGTCITYDWVDVEGNYWGGSISLGLNMRYKALKHYTKRLPLLQPDKDFNLNTGLDTTEAIRSGVQNGLKYEMEGFLQHYVNQQPEMNIILTGGDWNFFDTQLKNSIFAPYLKIEPYLVLKGLNAVILQHK